MRNAFPPLPLVTFVVAATAPFAPGATTFFVRPDGGSPQQCTGLADAPYPGSGSGQPCAFNHPFQALPPLGAPRLAGGDTLLIGPGAYMMGVGAPGAEACGAESSWECVMPPIPSGPDAAHPTRLLGRDCHDPPQLWGTERAARIINLEGSSHVHVACLEITDRADCVEFHSGGHACRRDAPPFGPWAAVGVYASDSTGVLLHHLDIHGLAAAGVHAGRLTDWRIEDVRIAGNGWVGWDGDLGGDSSNRGAIIFRRVTIEWNGCAEGYPDLVLAGCWGQTAGGYGDGLGTAATGGEWIFEDCRVLHNTSDGLDLLYHDRGGSIVLNRVHAEGNAGNQVKLAGAATIINSVMAGNCAFFEGQPFTHHVDPCRALGSALVLAFAGGERVSVVNSTVYGQGDGLVGAGPRTPGACTGGETLHGRNNLFHGDADFFDPSDRTFLFYAEGCPGLRFDSDHSLYHDVKLGQYVPGPHDIGADPLLAGPLAGPALGLTLTSASPAIDAGIPAGAPAVDITGARRDAVPDIGAFEHGAPARGEFPRAPRRHLPRPKP